MKPFYLTFWKETTSSRMSLKHGVNKCNRRVNPSQIPSFLAARHCCVSSVSWHCEVPPPKGEASHFSPFKMIVQCSQESKDSKQSQKTATKALIAQSWGLFTSLGQETQWWKMDDDTICVMESLSTSKLNFHLLWTTFTHYWNSKLIQELLAGRVHHTASPEFEH